jgi:putative peptidoglycan lipid II flippase
MGAALVVMSGIVASKGLGLVRNIVISHQYGATREYESFLAAISIPDTVFQVLAGGAVSAAFIPVFTAYLAEGQDARAWRLTSALMNLAILVIGIVAVILAVLAPLVAAVLVPGWDATDQARVTTLTRMMLISPVIFTVSTLATSALNGTRRFALSAAAPLMYNLALIIGAVFLRGYGIEGLAFSAVVGALLHFAIQIPGLAMIGFRYRPTLGLDLAGTREVAQLMIPRVLGLGVSQLNLLVNVALASFLLPGSIAYLNYAWLILMVPLGVFAMGLATAIFPTFAEQHAAHRTEEEQQTFLFGIRLILYTTIPAAVGLIVLRHPLVSLLLERGAFDEQATAMTAFALLFYAIGLPGHAVIEIVDRVFYAERDTRTPVVVAAGAVGLNIALCLLLMRAPLSFGGLALANSLAALTEASVLTVLLQRRMGWFHVRVFFGFTWRIVFAALCMGIVGLAVEEAVLTQVQPTGILQQTALLLGIVAVGTATFLAISLAIGIDDLQRLLQLLRRRGRQAGPAPLVTDQ